MYVPLCEPWPLPPSGCPDLTGSTPEVVTLAQLAASEELFELSGYQFGSCSVLIRPCRKACVSSSWAAGPWWWTGLGWPMWPGPWAGNPFWLDAACGRCTGGCDCGNADTLVLPDLVQSVTEVLVDGEVLPASSYHLFNGRLLVRSDGEQWPMCQDWAVPVSGSGAWSVEAIYGRPVPALGQLALGQASKEFADFCTTGQCKLPAYTTGVTRQGVAQQFPSIVDLAKTGRTGLLMVDRFLDSFNPDRLRGHPQVWNPDDFEQEPRRPGGAWG